MSVENDLVRVRQEIARLKVQAGVPGSNGTNGTDGTDGLNVFITYHASNLDATPANATGDGTTGGWHRTYATGDNWMSTKTALIDTEGTWSDPIAIRGLPGVDAAVYYIKPITGTAIKNHVGTLTVEAHLITGGTDELLAAGTIKLYDPSNNEITVANGYAAGSDGYTGVLDATDINLSKVISLKDGPTGEVIDTVTLVDVEDGDDGTDGVDGEDAIVGSVDSNNGLAWTQAPGPGAWTPSGTTTTLTVTFYQGGASIATRTVVITRSDATLTAPTPDTVDGITYTRLGNGSSAITIVFEHVASAIKVSETVYAVAGGADGEDGAGDGSGLSDDIPWLNGITFVGNTGSGKVGWTAGTLDFGGVTYNIVAKATVDGDTNSYIYWDPAVSTTTFQTTNNLADVIVAGRWCVCKNIAGKAWPAAAHKVLLAGLIQAATLSAISAFLGTITSGSITLSLGGNAMMRIDSSGLYVSNDAGSTWTGVIKVVAGAVGLYADVLAAKQILTSMINDVAVGTGQIADNATQIFESEYTAAEQTITHGVEETIQTTEITSLGGLVQISGTCEDKLNSSGSLGGWIRLYRGSTQLRNETFYLDSAGAYEGKAISFVDSPGAGTFTYTLRIYVTGLGNHTAQYARLVASEYKGK